MDELEISGRRYISSVRAAKEHKYHSDYIGQLVRGGKVVGQKVGRAWYVDAASLAEYLGKEVPARGPMKSERKASGSEDRPLTSIVGSATGLSSEPPQDLESDEIVKSDEKNVAEPKSEVRDFSDDSDRAPSFVMPLRKAGRHHVIEAIDAEVPPAIKKIPEPKVVEQKITEVEMVQDIDIPALETTEEAENFIPLKITKPEQQYYSEPEDSFYKVSKKGLRYVTESSEEAPVKPRRIEAPARLVKQRSSNGGMHYLQTITLVAVAAAVSLGAGVLMSYYLHAVTTVQGQGQTSSVILSN